MGRLRAALRLTGSIEILLWNYRQLSIESACKLRGYDGLASLGTAGSGNPPHLWRVRLSRRVCGVVSTLSRWRFPDNNAFPHNHQRRAADSVLGQRDPRTSRKRGRLLARNRCPNRLKWMLARVGKLQVSRIFSWDNHRRSDLCSSRRLRLQPLSSVRSSFHDDRSDRSRYRLFVSFLVRTFSSRTAAIALAANSSNEMCYHPAGLNRPVNKGSTRWKVALSETWIHMYD